MWIVEGERAGCRALYGIWYALRLQETTRRGRERERGKRTITEIRISSMIVVLRQR